VGWNTLLDEADCQSNSAKTTAYYGDIEWFCSVIPFIEPILSFVWKRGGIFKKMLRY
jgi:hypothetical protein